MSHARASAIFLGVLWALVSYDAQAFTVKLTWQAPVTPPGVKGYQVHWGTSAGHYVETTAVGLATTAMLGGFLYETTYFFAVTAVNSAGESPYSNEVTVHVPEPIFDTELPVVGIITPANGAQVATKSTVPIAVTATDNVGVSQVTITVNGNVLCTPDQPPYNCPWKVPGAKKKTYVLEAFGVDAGGNLGSSPPVTVKSF